MVRLPPKTWQTGGRYFPAKPQRESFQSITRPHGNPTPVEFELPLSGNQNIAAGATATARGSVRAWIDEIQANIPRQMTATLVMDNSTYQSVTDGQGLTGRRGIGKVYVTSATVTLTNNKGSAQNAYFIVRGA